MWTHSYSGMVEMPLSNIITFYSFSCQELFYYQTNTNLSFEIMFSTILVNVCRKDKSNLAILILKLVKYFYNGVADQATKCDFIMCRSPYSPAVNCFEEYVDPTSIPRLNN